MIYSLGHRQSAWPLRHPVSGELWSTEEGPQGGDELNIIEAGKNYGWPLASLGRNYDAKGLPTARDHSMLADLRQRIREVKPGPNDLIYVLTDEAAGAVLRIEPAPAPPPTPAPGQTP